MIALEDSETSADNPEWEEFPFPFLPSYRTFHRERFGPLIRIVASDDRKMLLPVRIFSSGGLQLVQVQAPPMRRGEILAVEEERAFWEDFVPFVRRERLAQRIVHSPTFALLRTAPGGAVTCPFGTYVLELTEKTENTLIAGMHPKHRNAVRHAQGKVVCVFGREALADFHLLYASTLRREGLSPEPIAYFEALCNHLGERHFLVGVARDEKGPLGGVAFPFTSFCAHYLFGGSAEEMRVNGAMNLLHWESIRRLRSLGVKRIDYVGARIDPEPGSKYEGIQRFKERFGGTLHRGLLWKRDLSPWLCRSMDTLRDLRSWIRFRNAPKDLVDQERQRHTP